MDFLLGKIKILVFCHLILLLLSGCGENPEAKSDNSVEGTHLPAGFLKRNCAKSVITVYKPSQILPEIMNVDSLETLRIDRVLEEFRAPALVQEVMDSLNLEPSPELMQEFVHNIYARRIESSMIGVYFCKNDFSDKAGFLDLLVNRWIENSFQEMQREAEKEIGLLQEELDSLAGEFHEDEMALEMAKTNGDEAAWDSIRISVRANEMRLNYLLERKAEAQINKGSQVPNARVIEPARLYWLESDSFEKD